MILIKESKMQKEIETDDETIGELRLQIKEKNKWISELLAEVESIKDTCEKCGCNEFLCGHNRRG